MGSHHFVSPLVLFALIWLVVLLPLTRPKRLGTALAAPALSRPGDARSGGTSASRPGDRRIATPRAAHEGTTGMIRKPGGHDPPSGWQVAWTYLGLGVAHILLGIDHLLFVLGLLLLVDRRWTLLKTITAFTVAHSLTLALATFAILRVPEPPLNATITLSILLLGPEMVRTWRGETSFSLRHPWVVAFAFGLLHGIGFWSARARLELTSGI